MKKKSAMTSPKYKRRSLVKSIGRMAGASLGLVFGFWLIMASNMGPAYLPHIMDGAWDFWIRMTLLGVGLGICISISVCLLWLVLRYFYDLIKRHQ